MDTLQSNQVSNAIPITAGTNVTPKGELIQGDRFDKNPLEKLQLFSEAEEQALREKQLNEKVETLIEFNGQPLAAFGADGFKTFFKNADGALASRFNPSDKEGIIAALKDKYGDKLDITQFSETNAPSRADIYDKAYGSTFYRNPINTFA